MVEVKVPASVANFGPGFDCMGVAVNLYNFIEMEFSDVPKIEVYGEGQGKISLGEDNLVYRAARTILKKAQIEKSLFIRLKNEIPLARGLGSSAACIAGGMMAANCLLGNPFSTEEIINFATEMEGHPDNVVAAIAGGFVISVKANDGVIYKKLSLPPLLKMVVAIPEFELKTERTREVIPKKVLMKDAVFNIGRTALLVAGICQGDFSLLQVATQDALHQPYRKSLVPGMEEILENASANGMVGCFLSGAGPSVVGLTLEGGEEGAGEFMVKAFEKKGIKARYVILDACDEGTTIIKQQ
ncbi:MAG: homoserine kinase [Tepidanaerobacteraceae bacterium]|nr:homoserine kinase [Tepidanaerobacteraceae bacterium]